MLRRRRPVPNSQPRLIAGAVVFVDLPLFFRQIVTLASERIDKLVRLYYAVVSRDTSLISELQEGWRNGSLLGGVPHAPSGLWRESSERDGVRSWWEHSSGLVHVPTQAKPGLMGTRPHAQIRVTSVCPRILPEFSVQKLVRADNPNELDKYTNFIIESIGRVFTSPTDKIFDTPEKTTNIPAKALKQLAEILAPFVKEIRH